MLQDAAVLVRERDPAIPRALAGVLDRALVERPAIGFQSAAELREALTRAL